MAAVCSFSFDRHGLEIWRGVPQMMRHPHGHTEIELNLITRGALTYRFGGEEVVFKSGMLHVFGGVTPHELRHAAPGSEYACVTVPLEAFIRWRLPENVGASILRGEIVTDSDGRHDAQRFSQWWNDLKGGNVDRHRIVLLEVQARLERMALSPTLTATGSCRPEARHDEANGGTLLRLERMLKILSTRFAESLNLADLARETGWHPHYASEQFRRWIGLPPGEFLIRQRVAHAKYILATSGTRVIDIAEECGFASQSSFYSAFTRLTGQAPAAFRRNRSTAA